ncbi:MAG: hypothetical protein E3J83_03525 [Candidatus Atribacteria bacterium]|nr:MAG: hypothetical protein E3J83_03525 [Candidatus Atribacteria bacterium]
MPKKDEQILEETTKATYIGLTPEQIAYAEEHHPEVNIGSVPGYNPDAPGTWEEHLTLLEAGGFPTEGLIEPGVEAEEELKPTKLPEYDPNAIPGIPVEEIKIDKLEVTEAPPYVISPEEEAWKGMHSGQIMDILKEGGIGIPEETQQLMKQQIFDDLEAKKTEDLRLLRNRMERRGITNSGLLISEEQKIISTATRALADSVTDIKIKSAFMKMASFENALGLSAQFLGYLQEQSRLEYMPKFATWEMRQQAGITEWQTKQQIKLANAQMKLNARLTQFQANVDMYKIKLTQAYAQDNMYLAAEIAEEAAAQQHLDNIELAEMEIEYAQEAAQAEAAGSISGTVVGGLVSIITK